MIVRQKNPLYEPLEKLERIAEGSGERISMPAARALRVLAVIPRALSADEWDTVRHYGWAVSLVASRHVFSIQSQKERDV